jgi:hypothetical protein
MLGNSIKFFACALSLCAFESNATVHPRRYEGFGFATQYHSWNSNDPEYNLGYTPNFISAYTPSTWVRSDIGWVSYAVAKDTYRVYSNDDQWIRTLKAAGQHVLVILNQDYDPPFYGVGNEYKRDSSGSSPAGRFLKWFATTYAGFVDAIEIGNEIQNSTQYWGHISTWMQNYVNFMQEAVQTVHAVAPSMKVIGYDAQGSQIIELLALSPPGGGAAPGDGVVYHPYNSSASNDGSGMSPESAYEPPYDRDVNGFVDFYRKVTAVTSMPVWMTEMAQNSGASEYLSAVWVARRISLCLELKVPYFMLYQFIGSDPGQSTFTYNDYPRWNNAVINRVFSILGPLSPTGTSVTATSTDPNFTSNSSNFVGFDFAGASAHAVVVWFGYVMWKGPYGSPNNVVAKANIVAQSATQVGCVTATDLVTGNSWATPFVQNGSDVTIQGRVSQHATVYSLLAGSSSNPKRSETASSRQNR